MSNPPTSDPGAIDLARAPDAVPGAPPAEAPPLEAPPAIEPDRIVDPPPAEAPPAEAPPLEAPGEVPSAAPPPEAAPPVTHAPADLAVDVENASRRFGNLVAVDGITFSVPFGTILGVIGPSGAGKTTAIRMMTGALALTGGRIAVLGENPRHFSRKARRTIGYMPQLFTLWRDLSARENVDFVASLYGMLFLTRRKRVREALDLVDLWPARNKTAEELSGGMQRRLELACALVHDPSLAFLDEPTAGIDPLLRGTIWDELHRRKDAGRTLVVTTQYVNEAEECDRVAMISDGRLIALAEPDELRRQATDGDLIEVETADPFDGRQLDALPPVRRIEQIDWRRFRVTVDDAGAATPDVLEAIDAKGVEVTSAREIRPSFDDVFATLVERDREARAAIDGEAGATDASAPASAGAAR